MSENGRVRKMGILHEAKMLKSPQDRIRQALDALLEEGVTEFPKLSKDDMPYRFSGWRIDRSRKRCLYYEFDSRDPLAEPNEKRIPLEELVEAMRECVGAGMLSHKRFARVCRVAHSAGDCGFAVAGRCLEMLGIAEYKEAGHEFRLTEKEHALEFLKDE